MAVAASETPRLPASSEPRAPVSDGVLFPLDDGARSTTATGRGILADAARAVDSELAREIEDTRDWRRRYVRSVRELTAASALTREAPGAIAEAGLASMHSRMVFERQHEAVAVRDAFRMLPAERLESSEIRGVSEPVTELRVPYKGRDLHGAKLLAQLGRWVERGVVEPSFASAIWQVAEHPEWLALEGRQVAIVGAGAEMGPLEPLSSWGAHVIAIDLPRTEIWERITEVARRGAGRLTKPVGAAGGPGVDVVRSLPEVRAWLDEAATAHELVLGMYAYADGGLHVRVTAAFDVLAADFLEHRHGTGLAYLATPTDTFVVPDDVIAHARAAYKRRGVRRVLQATARFASRGRLFAPAYASGSVVADALVVQQGPNYALAKRLQRWRGIITSARGQAVSFNVAPATWTASVTKNRILAAAYAGAHRFGVEIFEPATSRVLMAAMLVHDLHQAPSCDRHPEALFSHGAAHGGLWRVAYEPRSVLGVAALAGLPRTLRRGG